MKKLFLMVLPLVLTACVGSVNEMKAEEHSPNSAFLVLDADFTFDGDRIRNCFLQSATYMNDPNLHIIAADDRRLRIIKLDHGGTYPITLVECLEYKVLWNKHRTKHLLNALIVKVEPGTITYPGTVVGDWESQGFGALDLLAGGGAAIDDGGSFAMKREDRTATIKAYLQEKNPDWFNKYKFVTKKFENNPSIVQ